MKVLLLFGIILFMSCSDMPDVPDLEPIRMRVINRTDVQFREILLVPCTNTSLEPFVNVNPSDTTAYMDFPCGYLQTIVKGESVEGILYERNFLDFSNPLNTGDYSCIITLTNDTDLEISIQ